MNWLFAFRIWAAALLALPVCGVDPPGRSHLLLGDTISPNNAYAIAWTCPNLKDLDWDALPEDVKSLNDPLQGQVENSLVETGSGRKLADLSSFYWELPKGAPSPDRAYRWPRRVYQEVAWSRESDLVVVLQSYRYEYVTLEAVKLSKGKVVAHLEFGQELESLRRKHLAMVHPVEYKRDGDRLSIEFANVKVWDDGRITLEAMAGIWQGHDDPLNEHVTLTLPILKGKMRLQVSDFGAPDDQKPLDRATEDVKQVAAAEKELKDECQSLTSLLDAAASEALKREQIEWLQEHDKVTNLQTKATLIRMEAGFLRERRVEIIEKRWMLLGEK